MTETVITVFCMWDSCNFLLQHHQQDQIVCEVGIFLIVVLWAILYCSCETGCMAVHVNDSFDTGHSHERKKIRTFGDWLC